MAAALTDKFKKAGASTVTSLAAPGKAIGATSITVGSTTNYPLDTGVVIAIRVVDTAGMLVAGTYTEWNAIVTSATSFTLDPTPVYGSDQVYAAGSSTQVFISVSSSAHNQLVDGLLVSHDQDGTLKAGAVDVAAVLATDVVETAKIKDAAVTTAKIEDAAVTTAKIDFTSFNWTTVTPTITGITVGNGTLVARVQKIGTTVRYRGSFTLGSTSAVTGTVTIPLPHEAHASYTVNSQIGFGTALDFGTRLYGNIIAVLGSTTTFTLRVSATISGTNPVFTEIGSSRVLNTTVPITFGNQDEFTWFVEYESAA